MNAGMASEKSRKLISTTDDIIITPTSTSTGAVAAAGIDRKSGAKKSDAKKHNPHTKAVNPLRPPCSTPAALSTNVVTVLLPIMAPVVVANASTINACLRRGILPFLIMPARVATPIRVPMVSKRSTKRRVKTMTNISAVNIFDHSNLQKIGSIDGGVLIKPVNCVTPNGIPMSVVAMIPINSAPGTFLMRSTDESTMPIMHSNAGPWEMSPRLTSVASLLTTMSALLKPMNAM